MENVYKEFQFYSTFVVLVQILTISVTCENAQDTLKNLFNQFHSNALHNKCLHCFRNYFHTDFSTNIHI